MNPYTDYLPPYNLESSNNDASSSLSWNIDSSSNQDHPKTSHMIRWKSGKLNMLEQFEEIYEDRHELFDKMFHGDHERVFHKIGGALKKKKKQMKKSGSMKRMMRAISRQESADELRLQRFKIRTPIVIEAAEEDDAQAAQPHQSTTTKGSK